MMTLLDLPQIKDYKALEIIHESDRTLVYRGQNINSQQPIIIKLMRNEYPSFNELVKFRNQYAIMLRIADANAKNIEIEGIIKPYALERYENRYALIMEDVGGIALSERQGRDNDRPRTMEIAEFLNIAIQLADILHQLHQNRVIHKDIKPANILIHPQTQQVKLIDFSISSLLPKETQTIQTPNVLEGTLSYLSPEQTGRMNRGIDYRSDFYSLGVTFYELLTGQLPFESEDPLELVHAHLAKSPPLISHPSPVTSDVLSLPKRHPLSIPETLAGIVMKLMAKNAEDRYQSALGLKYDLEKCWLQYRETGKIESFALGENDRCDRFVLPEKLYGRENEVQILLDAFERVASPPTPLGKGGEYGRAEMVLVAGFSGIGKTAAINEVHKPIVRQHGYFIKGKFDQFQRNIPFSALVQAFRDLMGQLLGESDEQLQRWKAKILQALGEQAGVISETIPELEQIIGPQLPVPDLSGSAAQNRFNRLFERFIQVFATPEHPLVIFIDDLQWADAASLKLMQFLMGDAGGEYLLLLGAYRDNEVSPTHPLMLAIAEIEKSGAAIETITLAPLSQKDINRLIADGLGCGESVALPLTELVYGKTKGNPFFSTQFLKGLQVDGWIAFNGDLGYWQCDLTKVRELALSDDVVEFMAARLHKLPEETCEILKLAACIGNRFELEILAAAGDFALEDAAAALWPAMQAGFILPVSNTYKFFQEMTPRDRESLANVAVGYQFLHDRVQQAAYSLIPEVQKQVTHYRIGKRLLAHLSSAEREEKIFDIVNQINFGREAIADAEEKQHLIELNFRAGQKAKTSTAYEAAKMYFGIAIELLPDNTWEHTGDRAFELHFAIAEVQLMSVDLDSFEKTIATLLELAPSALDNARVYALKVNQYSLQGAYPQAIEAGLAALQRLGTTVKANNIKQWVREEAISIEAELQHRPIEALLDLPPATHPAVQVEIELLMKVLSAAYINSNRDLYSFAVVRSARLSMEYGNIPKSIMTYASYGEWLALLQHEYQRAMQFSELALQLSYKLDNKSERSSACFLLGGCVYVKAKPIQGAAELNYEGFLAGIESGELQYAGYNLFANIYNRLFGGENLAEIATDLEKFWAIANKIHNDLALSVLEACRFFIEKLSGSNDGESAAERAWLERHHTAQSYLPLGIYNILHLHLACLYGDFARGCDYGIEAGKFLLACESCTIALGYYYYSSLNLLRRDAELSEKDRQQIETNQGRLKILAESCPENFLHKYLLVEAERARIAGDRAEALDLYDRAISQAKDNQYVQEEALACELAARFSLDWDKENIAGVYIQQAYYSYARWGAKNKTDDLEKRYPQLLSLILQHKQSSLTLNATVSSLSGATITSTTAGTREMLDLAALMKAARTLSEEIELDRAIANLMQVIIENAGADTAALMLSDEQTLYLEAKMSGGVLETLDSLPVETSAAVPQNIINTVKRTRKSLLLENTGNDTTYIGDAYIQQHQPQSILCLPLLDRRRLVGILYLENQRVAGVFTRDRVEILNLLCSQAVISLENARLYRQTQQALKDLQQAQLQLVQNEKMATLGNLVAGVAHEINNPLGFIGGNVKILQDNFTDLFAIFEGYREECPEPSTQLAEEIEEMDLDFLLEDIPKTIASMQKGVQRIRNISTSLRTFSRTDADKKTEFNLHEGIDSSLLILKYRLKANEERPAIKIVKNYGNIAEVKCYAGQINQVFMNLLANAIDALDESNTGKTYTEIEKEPNCITISTELSENKKNVIVRITDNGMGMSDEVKARIFEQGFTTKEVGRGTGLGMAIAQQIITEKHGGAIACHSELGKGTEFIISLPAS